MIIIEESKFKYWIESLGCDCCTQGNYHIENNGLYFRWQSNINNVITKHDDLVLEFDKV